MSITANPTLDVLRDLLKDAETLRDRLRDAAASDAPLDRAATTHQLAVLARRAHALWITGAQDIAGAAFDDMVTVKAAIQNATVECRRSLGI
ncbi:hypothetical protein [Paraburkholderia sp.]|uniref:hypothetical protein n=1 Tax=Paraburkholderia sp. TaxID=1926495 RepID=UPI003D6E8EB1